MSQTQEAYALGEDHARTAASWVTDGNESDESRLRKLELMEEGDPQVWDMLPTCPNLSGEFADDLTPRGLFAAITGLAWGDESGDLNLMDALAEAYEEGVSETFEMACEAELRRWVD